MENFNLSLKYIKWRQNTSKIGKVLVDGYEVELNDSQEIVFKEKGYSLFKVNSEKGIILLPVKQSKKIQTNSQNAFCQLVKSANNSANNFN